MYTETGSRNIRANLSAYLDQVQISGTRVLIRRHGRDVAALVSVKDFRALEQVEQGGEAFWEARHARQLIEMRLLREALCE